MKISKTTKRWLLRLAAILTGGLALLLWTQQQHTPSHLAVENQSGQVIAQLKVTVAQRTTSFENVATKTVVYAPLGTQGGDDFAVSGQLADGSLIRGRGMVGEGRSLVIMPGGIISVRQRDKGS